MEAGAVPYATLGQLLFTMMGPVGLIPVFARVAGGADRALRIRVALAAFALACAALALATLVGASMLASSGTRPEALIIAAGLVLTLVSLRNVLAMGAPATPPPAPPALSLAAALQPLAFPTMVQPYGVGVLIIFVAYFPAPEHKLGILGVALAVMTLNLAAMLAARRVMAVVGPVPLIILGAVLSILQVALGIQMLLNGFARAGAWS